MQFYEVQFSAVAFVLAEAIIWETRAEVPHNRVARDLRDHARGRDGETVAIAVDDRCLGQGEGENRQPIDQDMLRLKGEAGQRQVHRLVGRAQDVDRVDLDGIDDPHCPRDASVRRQVVIDLLTFLRQKLLRIVQLPVPELLRKNNRGGYDRPGQRAASRLINSRDAGNSKRAKFAFMPESAASVHAGKILKS